MRPRHAEASLAFSLLADESKKEPLVVATELALHRLVQTPLVALLVLVLDLWQVDLVARHNQADQVVVVGAQALHRLVEHLGEVAALVAHTLDCCWRCIVGLVGQLVNWLVGWRQNGSE